MRRYLLAAVAVAAIATPAGARVGSFYTGLEAGVVFPRDSDADVDVFYSTLNVPGGVPNTPIFVNQSFHDAISLDAKTGYEIGIFGGYDFGMFRVEGEIDWKHANLDDVKIDSNLLAALNAIDSTAPFINSDFNIDEAVGTLSFMLNGLLDFGDEDGLSFQGGVGVGWAKTKLIDDK
ncbi:MAG TPA: hypothetical protein VKA61_09765, partial [Sphingomicrobium sp.]|nr:hypothetical protein [Sphingomicrobium sp.]